MAPRGLAAQVRPRTSTMAPRAPVIQIRPDTRVTGELALFIDNIQPGTTIYDLIKNFESRGTITYIEIFADREHRGKVRFSPPPRPFWTEGRYPITTEKGNTYDVRLRLDLNSTREKMVASRFRRNVYYPERMKFDSSTLQFGLMVEEDRMMPMQTLRSQAQSELSLTVDLRRRKLEAQFTVYFRDPRSQGDDGFTCTGKIGEFDRIERYMFHIPFEQLKSIQRFNLDPDGRNFSLLISLDSPPQFYRWRDDREVTKEGALSWTQWDSWFRQTDIVYDPFQLLNAAISLHKERPLVDIGNSTPNNFDYFSGANLYRTLDYLPLGFQQ